MNGHALILTSCVIAVVTTGAYAAEGTKAPGPSLATTFATTSQTAVIESVSVPSAAGNNSVSDMSASGFVNVQQNTGSNSVLQSANTLAAILDCHCVGDGGLTSQAEVSQNAVVLGDITVRTPYGVTARPSGETQDLSQRTSAIAPRRANAITNFGGGPGLYNVSQNTGSNAALQSANAVAEIEGTAQSRGTTSPAH